VGVALPCALGFLALADPSLPAIAIGATIAAVGLLIRAVAAGQLRKHEALTTTGMYGITRHPLYLGSAVLGAGFLVAGRSWPASLFVLAYALAFYPAIMRHEEARLRARYGRAFEEHAARTPMLRPRLSAIGSAGAGFAWQTYRQNREYRAAAGAALGFLSLYVRLWLSAHP
jgi:protein-S-isoprenylcysteine O-methyltransferase Ste14